MRDRRRPFPREYLIGRQNGKGEEAERHTARSGKFVIGGYNEKCALGCKYEQQEHYLLEIYRPGIYTRQQTGNSHIEPCLIQNPP